jgi:hypothetical protein
MNADQFFEWLYDHLHFVILVLVSFAVGAIIAAAYQNQALMAQCQADGHKEYECVGILRGRR